MNEPSYTGAVAPERSRDLHLGAVRLRVYEWGDPAGDPLILSHGMFDHARGFDTLAPFLAERFRVLAFDARGHGDSSWTDAYLWPTDVADLQGVLRSLDRPARLLGHSRGGGLATDAAVELPERVRCVVNIDGFGPPPDGFDAPGADDERPLPQRLAEFLDGRRRAAQRQAWRPYASLEALVERRRLQNPRLSREWLRYFLFHGARQGLEGWSWKADPHAGRPFVPWDPDWIAPLWRHLRVPLLAVTGSEPDTWGPLPEPVLEERLSHLRDFERVTVEGAGHFVHMEQPEASAKLVLPFLEAA